MTVRGTVVALAVAVTVAAVLTATPALSQQGAPSGEWPYYGGDLGGTKYSGLDQIDATNFNELEIAWRWQSADGGLDLDPPPRDPRRSEPPQPEGDASDGGRCRLRRYAASPGGGA